MRVAVGGRRGVLARGLLAATLVLAGTAALSPAAAEEAPHQISATVVDGAGQPVDGMVEVFDFFDDGMSGYYDVYDYVDVHAGQFSVWVPRGTYTFHVHGDGSQVDEWYDDAQSLGDDTPVRVTTTDVSLGTIELASEPTVSGHVVGADDRPAPGVTVTLVDAERTLVAGTVSGPDGAYRLPDVTAGEFAVRFSDDRRRALWAPQWFSGRRLFSDADRVAFDGLHDLDLGETVLLRGAQISGHVTGVDGAPLSHVVVTAYDPGNEVERETTTDSTGYYQIPRLPPGEHLVGFEDTLGDYRPAWYDDATRPLDATPVLVRDATARAGVDQQLTPSVFHRPARTSVTGHVRDEDGVPLPGVRVEAWADLGGGPEVVADDLSDRAGRWFLTGLPPGGYQVSFADHAQPTDQLAHVREYYDDVPLLREARTVWVRAGEVTSGVEARLLQYGGITGGVRDTQGGPLARTALVSAYDEDGTRVATQRTGPNGRYRFARLVPGRYRVLVEPDSPTVSYVRQWFGHAWSFATATVVRVRSGRVHPRVGVVLESAIDPVSGPGVRGRPVVGEQLTGRHGTWTLMAGVAWTYRWTRDGVVVGRDRTYRLRRADVGRRLRLAVRASRGDLVGWARAPRTPRVTR